MTYFIINIKQRYCILFLLLALLPASAQRINQQDSLRIEELSAITKDLSTNNQLKAVQAIREIIQLSLKNNDAHGFIVGYNALGSFYQRQSDYKKALYYDQKAIDISERENLRKDLGMVLYNTAGVYERMGNYTKAFETSILALQIRIEYKDSSGIARCYRQIGQCLRDKDDYALSIVYFKKAVAIQRRLNVPKSLGVSLNNLSIIYIAQKQYSDALNALNEAKYISDSLKDWEGLPSIFLNIGFCYDNMGRSDSAEFYYLQSFEKLKQFDMVTDEIIVSNNLGKLYLTKKNYVLAEKYLLEGLRMAKETNSLIDLKDLQENLAALYFIQGDYKKAYAFKEAFIVSADSLMNQQKMKAIEELSIRFETKEITEKNKLLLSENAFQKIKVEQKNYLILAFILVTVLLGIIFVLYIRQNKFKQQKKSLDIEQKLLQIQMNPHFIFNSLQAIQSFILTNQQQQSASYLTSFSRLMRLILENSKQEFISLDKEITTLTYYLELQKLRFKEVFSYTIHVDDAIDKEYTLVPPMLLQPFIENSIEHGFKQIKEKGELLFNVSKTDSSIVLEIIDNGMGIEKSMNKKLPSQKDHHSYALEIIKKRIELLNQKLKTNVQLIIIDVSTIDKNKQGTKISIKIPHFH